MPRLLGGMRRRGPDRPTGPLGSLPATYAGDLPCADCASLRYKLTLFPDQVYFLSRTYLGKDASPVVYDIGNWTLSDNRKVLTLTGEREQIFRFTVSGEEELHLRGLDGRDIESQLHYTLIRSPRVEPIEPRTVMRGMYRYMADAGTFKECLTGRRWPVSQERNNADLERAYSNERRQPNEELLVVLEGSVVMRPAMEETAAGETLVVERIIELRPRETCGARFATDPLENTYWKLTRLGTVPVVVTEHQREPSLVLHADNHRVAGSGGCNRLMGSYVVEGRTLHFNHMASTKMACPEGMQQEQAFLDALNNTATWKIAGEHLELYDDQGTTLARFEATHLR
ncbi:META domain-containing protein [Nitrospira japonica]|uniref:META domain-containing protein n=1 Tax=Nitrospira japonica TaxID=1325564 RepID=UPI00155FEDC1|nr:META domain-containing protein [Nitrospira japonica]